MPDGTGLSFANNHSAPCEADVNIRNKRCQDLRAKPGVALFANADVPGMVRFASFVEPSADRFSRLGVVCCELLLVSDDPIDGPKTRRIYVAVARSLAARALLMDTSASRPGAATMSPTR